MKNKTYFSVRDYQLFSAYIDGELSPRHKKYVEGLMAENSEAQQVVEKIKKVKTLLINLPARKVPRNFTITASETQRFQLPSLAGVFRYSTAVSALLLAVILALDYFSPFQTRSILPTGESLVEKSASVEDTLTETDGSGPIITWHPSHPPAAEEGFGYGGGDDGELGMGGLQPEPQIPSSIIPPQESFSEKMPFPAQENPVEEDEQLPQMLEEQPQAESEGFALDPKSSADENGPILGVRPSEEQGRIQTGIEPFQVSVVDSRVVSLRLVEIVLAGLVLVSAFLNFTLRKNKK